MVYCKFCCQKVKYGGKGKSMIKRHADSTAHKKKRGAVLQNQCLPAIFQTNLALESGISSTQVSGSSSTSGAPTPQARPAWDLKGRLQDLQQLAQARNNTIEDLKLVLEQKESELLGLEATKRAQETDRHRLNNEIEEWKQLTDAHKSLILQKDSEIQSHETERCRLHNLVQELKGNIRVFCRVRPLLKEEELGREGINIHFPGLDHKILELEKTESMPNTSRDGRQTFKFDKVFMPESTQAEVFEEISQLVQRALDGYNVCIFAYGQTGSGKTYTMEGCLEDEESLGMIPRTVQQIFTAVHGLEGKGWSYKFRASMLEIYNENLYEVQVLKLLRRACENRSVAETKCNSPSSRSHSVFQLKLEGANSITGESSKGLLNLVDLAGSESVKASGSEGLRLVEAQNINKSLSSLANVIMALGNKVNKCNIGAAQKKSCLSCMP